jgi:hypothetical protein
MGNGPDDVVAGDGPGKGYVSGKGIIALALYLILFTLGLIWTLYAWWPDCDPTPATTSASASASPKGVNAAKGSTAAKEQVTPSETATPEPTTTTATKPASVVKVTSVVPKSGDVAGGTLVEIAGEGFLAKPKVTFGDSSATEVQRVSAASISAKTPPHSAGAVDVTVTNTDDSTGTLSSGYTYDTCLAQCRSRLLLLVLLAGALGACFHALRSLWMFVGNRDLKQSWVLMYILLPINGAVLAFIFFIIISAGSGFFSQPQGSNSCFWIIGIAALVGLFSQQAAERLKTIAEAVFSAVPKKADSLTAQPSGSLSVTSIDPATGPVAGGTTVTIIGTGFTNTCTVSFGDVAGTNFKFSSSSSISVDTPAGKQAGPVDVTVTEPASNAKGVKAGGYTYQ